MIFTGSLPFGKPFFAAAAFPASTIGLLTRICRRLPQHPPLGSKTKAWRGKYALAILDAHGDSEHPQRGRGSGSLLDDETTPVGSGSRGAEDLVDEPAPLGRTASGVGIRDTLANRAVF